MGTVTKRAGWITRITHLSKQMRRAWQSLRYGVLVLSMIFPQVVGVGQMV
jgi:hypothetical protein